MSKEKIVKQLIDYAKTKVKINIVYLDRGFFSCKIINLLNKMNVKFLMPAIKNERVMKLANEYDSPKVIKHNMGIIRGKKNRMGFRKDSAYFNLVIVDDKDGIKRTFATNLDVEEKDALNLFELYGKRWGIETSYRVKGEFRVKTTSKNYVIRLFYFMFSVCLYNLWVLATIFIGKAFGVLFKESTISAKIFGTLLHKTVMI